MEEDRYSKVQESQKEEAALRTEEMRWQTEEESRSEEVSLLHQKQEGQWLKWQDALRRKAALEDEISQIDQSAKALQVMVQELRDHRDQASQFLRATALERQHAQPFKISLRHRALCRHHVRAAPILERKIAFPRPQARRARTPIFVSIRIFRLLCFL